MCQELGYNEVHNLLRVADKNRVFEWILSVQIPFPGPVYPPLLCGWLITVMGALLLRVAFIQWGLLPLVSDAHPGQPQPETNWYGKQPECYLCSWEQPPHTHITAWTRPALNFTWDHIFCGSFLLVCSRSLQVFLKSTSVRCHMSQVPTSGSASKEPNQWHCYGDDIW